MKKAEWKARALDAEARLALPARLTFDTVTVCFTDKTVSFRGRVITVDANCVSFPLTNDQHILLPAGWVPLGSGNLA